MKAKSPKLKSCQEIPTMQNLEEKEGTCDSGVDKGKIYHDRQEMRLRGC